MDAGHQAAGVARLPTAICVIRCEPLDNTRMLFSIAMTPDIERGGFTYVRRVSDPQRMLQVVADFLVEIGVDAGSVE